MKPTLMLLAATLALAACGPKSQTAGTRVTDDKPWDLSQPGFAAGGFKPGDKAAWEGQLKVRAQAQNEYNRTVSR